MKYPSHQNTQWFMNLELEKKNGWIFIERGGALWGKQENTRKKHNKNNK